MKIPFYLTSLIVFYLFSSANASGFEYFENFENYEEGVDFEKGYNQLISKNNSIIFSSGVATKLISLNGPIHGITEDVPIPPQNEKIENSMDHSLRTGDCTNCVIQFSNSGSSDLSIDAWSEQRFLINPSYLSSEEQGLKDFWIQYDQYIPKNFHYRDSDADTATNWYGGGVKVIALFADDYSNLNPTMIIGRLLKRMDSQGPVSLNGESYADFNFSTKDPISNERRWFSNMGFELGDKMIIDPLVDIGHWQRRTYHVGMPTSNASNDGIVEFWIQRRLGTENPIVEKIIDVSNGNFYGGGQNYINKGYLLGWSNTGYNTDVTYLIDNLIVAKDAQAIDRTAIFTSFTLTSPPSAPDVRIE
jgi:hypothetical protein